MMNLRFKKNIYIYTYVSLLLSQNNIPLTMVDHQGALIRRFV